jgi:hypothetical protein
MTSPDGSHFGKLLERREFMRLEDVYLKRL